jgi:hypothetical protein
VLRAQREGRVAELVGLVPNNYALDSLGAPVPIVALERILADPSNVDSHWVWRHCRGDVAATKRALELTPGIQVRIAVLGNSPSVLAFDRCLYIQWEWNFCGPSDPLPWLDWLVHDAKLVDVKHLQVSLVAAACADTVPQEMSDMGIQDVSAAHRIRFLDHFKLGWHADLFQSALIEGDIAAVQWMIKHRERLIRRPADIRSVIPDDSPRDDLFSDLRVWDRGHVIRWLKETGALMDGRYVRFADGAIVRL